MTNKLNSFKKIIEEISGGTPSTKDLQKSLQYSDILINIIELEKLGFIERVESNTKKQLSQTSWKITDKGNFFLSIFDTLFDNQFSVVMTIPPKFSFDIEKRFDYIKPTDKVFKNIVQDAESEIKILSPYIDASFISILEKADPKVLIKIITTPVKYSRVNPLLERLKTRRPISVKYLNEEEKGTQIYQLHAKIFIIDNKKLYIGSANLKETILFYNLESGILLIQTEDIIEKYSKIFDYFYEMLI